MAFVYRFPDHVLRTHTQYRRPLAEGLDERSAFPGSRGASASKTLGRLAAIAKYLHSRRSNPPILYANSIVFPPTILSDGLIPGQLSICIICHLNHCLVISLNFFASAKCRWRKKCYLSKRPR